MRLLERLAFVYVRLTFEIIRLIFEFIRLIFEFERLTFVFIRLTFEFIRLIFEFERLIFVFIRLTFEIIRLIFVFIRLTFEFIRLTYKKSPKVGKNDQRIARINTNIDEILTIIGIIRVHLRHSLIKLLNCWQCYSVIEPCSVSLNAAVSLKVSSMTSCLPPVSLGLIFLMITSPSFFPFKRALTSRFIFFCVGSSPVCGPMPRKNVWSSA